MNRKSNFINKLIAVTALGFGIGLVVSPLALAEKVKVNGGGTCEGDITVSNLNGQVICNYRTHLRFN